MYPKKLQELIVHFSALPSIGPKMAERLVLYLFKKSPEEIDSFAKGLSALSTLSQCTQCFNIAENDLCVICADTHRIKEKICVVEESLDIIPIERTKSFDGLYHVLGGTLESGNGETTDLKITELLTRIKNDSVAEVIIATNFTTEGDMTALYLKRKLADFPDLALTRLARGLATGSDIEYADDQTLQSALANRSKL